MSELTDWLESNRMAVVTAATEKLSNDEILQYHAAEAVEVFVESLIQTARTDSPTPLHSVLVEWVEARSIPVEDEITGIIHVLTMLKQAIWEQIQQRCPPHEALGLLVATDGIFTQATVHLAHLEADALLEDVRGQLREAREHVERLDKSKTNFIAVAAHELKTPLTLIEGYAEMIQNTAKSTGDTQQALLVDGIRSGIRRLREIVQDMIDVSVIDLKMLHLHFQPVFLHQLLAAVERNVRDVVAERNIEFVIEREKIPRQQIYADPDRLLQVLQKVVLNAVKYTPDGGRVIISARELRGFTDVVVIDNGIGIAAADLPHIFDTFSSQGDVALHSSGKTKFKGGGPGLGLAIAKGIIDAHGGTIWAESPGHDEEACPGSTFHIMVPMLSAPPQS